MAKKNVEVTVDYIDVYRAGDGSNTNPGEWNFFVTASTLDGSKSETFQWLDPGKDHKVVNNWYFHDVDASLDFRMNSDQTQLKISFGGKDVDGWFDDGVFPHDEVIPGAEVVIDVGTGDFEKENYEVHVDNGKFKYTVGLDIDIF